MRKDTLIPAVCRTLQGTTAFLKRHGCSPVKGHYGSGYHYHSGFFTSPNGLLWYWSSGDDRLNPVILFRRVRDLNDYTGMINQYPKTGEDFDNMISWYEKREVA